VSPLDVVTHVPDREIDGVIFMLTSCDGSCRFVASKYDGDKDRSVCINILRNKVLSWKG
jgi:hypothetical protein